MTMPSLETTKRSFGTKVLCWVMAAILAAMVAVSLSACSSAEEEDEEEAATATEEVQENANAVDDLNATNEND